MTGSAPDIVRLEGTHISTDREITMHCGDQKPFQPGKHPVIGKQIAFAVLYAAIIASASIVGFSILNNGRNLEFTSPSIRSDIAGGTESVTISGSAEVRSGSAATIPT